MKLKTTLLSMCLILAVPFVRANEEGEEGGARVGAGKAILAADHEQGFKPSPEAIKKMGLGYMTVTGGGTFKVSLSAVVFFQDELGIYRFQGGWIKLLEVELVSKTATEAVIRTSELKSGDQIVKDGVPLLRAAELEVNGGSGEGHGH